MNLTQFDPINALDGLFGAAFHGPMHRFTFRPDVGVSALDVEKLMQQYGIRIWGREVHPDGERSFLVKQRQAVWAEYLLCRAGIPLTCSYLDPRNAAQANVHAGRSMPAPWSQKGVGPHSFVDHMVHWVDRILG